MSDYTQPGFSPTRHIGPDSAAVTAMLEVIGVDSLEELARRALPAGILDELTGSGAAPGLDHLGRRHGLARPKRWLSCGRWPTPTPSRCR